MSYSKEYVEELEADLAFYFRKCDKCGDHLGLLLECPHCRKITKLREALERSQLAIDDWLNTFADDLCNKDRVTQAHSRIFNQGGTLMYIAKVQEQNREALKDE